jgi:hypothetical protein
MKRMLLAVFAVAAVGLSAGAVLAQQNVVCQPVCGLVNAAEAGKQHSQQGKDNAASHMNQQGVNHNSAGVGASSGGGGGGGGPVVLF